MTTPLRAVADSQYDQLVRKGREARKQADNVQWVEGDLALEVETLHPTDRPRDPVSGDFLADPDKALKRYADDIDVNYSALKNYRVTAERWPAATRVAGACWRTHFELRTMEDRFDAIAPGMTSREAAKIVRDWRGRANTGWTPSWHELLGRVGDSLTDALKQLAAAEAALTREPNARFVANAEKFADRADEIAARLREIHKPPEQAV